MPSVEELKRIHEEGYVFEGSVEKMPILKARDQPSKYFDKNFVVSRNPKGLQGTLVVHCSDSAEAKQRYAFARNVNPNEVYLHVFPYKGEFTPPPEEENSIVFNMASSIVDLDVSDRFKGLLEEAGLNTLGEAYAYDIRHLSDGGLTSLTGIGDKMREAFYQALGMEAPDFMSAPEEPSEPSEPGDG